MLRFDKPTYLSLLFKSILSERLIILYEYQMFDYFKNFCFKNFLNSLYCNTLF